MKKLPFLFLLYLLSCEPKQRIVTQTAEETVTEADPNDVFAKRSKEEITVNYDNASTFQVSFPDSSIHAMKLEGVYEVRRSQPIMIPKSLLPLTEKTDFATFHFVQRITLLQDGHPQSSIFISKEMFNNHLSDTLKRYGVLRPVAIAGFNPKDSTWHFTAAVGIPMTVNAKAFEFSLSANGKFKSAVSIP